MLRIYIDGPPFTSTDLDAHRATNYVLHFFITAASRRACGRAGVRLKHDVDVGLATMELSRESLVIFNHLDDSERMLALSRQVLVLVPVTRGPKSIPRGSREV
jgi:hypothetical protein